MIDKNKFKTIWLYSKSVTPLNKSELSKIKSIFSNHNKRVTRLKKENKWEGISNEKNKKAEIQQRNSEIKKIIPKKASKFLKSRKEYNARK